MRILIGAVLVVFGSAGICLAQDDRPPSSITPDQREAVSDRKAEEVRAASRRAQKRQDAINASYRALMTRWSMAVCIGCEPGVRIRRVLHTYPLRVLAGIPAVDDDARERRGRVRLKLGTVTPPRA